MILSEQRHTRKTTIEHLQDKPSLSDDFKTCVHKFLACIPGVPNKAERSIFVTVKFENVAYFYFIR